MAEGLRNRFGAHELIRTERGRDRRFENVKLTRIGRMPEQRRRHAEVLAKNVGRDVLEPVAEQNRVVFVKVPMGKDEEKSASIRAGALNRMGDAAGKIPQIDSGPRLGWMRIPPRL